MAPKKRDAEAKDGVEPKKKRLDKDSEEVYSLISWRIWLLSTNSQHP